MCVKKCKANVLSKTFRTKFIKGKYLPENVESSGKAGLQAWRLI